MFYWYVNCISFHSHGPILFVEILLHFNVYLIHLKAFRHWLHPIPLQGFLACNPTISTCTISPCGQLSGGNGISGLSKWVWSIWSMVQLGMVYLVDTVVESVDALVDVLALVEVVDVVGVVDLVEDRTNLVHVDMVDVDIVAVVQLNCRWHRGPPEEEPRQRTSPAW